MRCISNIEIYYNEIEDTINFAHCCYSRVGQCLGKMKSDDFINMPEKDFYDYLDKIAFIKPVDCYILNPGKTCKEVWRYNDEISIRVAISRECNIHCPMCYARYGGHHDSPKRKWLYLYTIEKLKNYKFNNLWLTDWGEAFIYLNEVLDIVKNYSYCKKISITTNATLMTKDLLLKLKSSCDQIFLEIDLDGLSKETLESVRVGANFNIVFKNIINAIQFSKKYPTNFEIAFHHTITKTNRCDLEKILAFANKFKIPIHAGEEFEVPRESIFNY